MNLSRKDFIIGLGLTSLGCAAGCRTRAQAPLVTRPIALQLWSIHKIFWQDPARHLADIRAAGYDGVEFAGFNDLPAKEIRKLLADAGLRGEGAHLAGTEQFEGDGLKRNLDYCAEAGLESLTNAWADFDSRDEWVRFGELMGRAARTAKDWNLPLGMHNHVHEFTKRYGGVCAWDLLFSEADPLLRAQVDTSQVVNAGCDCVAQLRKQANRHHSVHMKENTPTEDGYFGVAPADGRIVDWRGTVAYLETESAFRWYVVECERRPDSLEPAVFNVKFLRQLRA